MAKISDKIIPIIFEQYKNIIHKLPKVIINFNVIQD